MEFKELTWADRSRYTGDFVWNNIQGLEVYEWKVARKYDRSWREGKQDDA